jgi:hypothetical protein
MKNFLFSCFALSYSLCNQAQQLPNRYRNDAITAFEVNKDIAFSTNIPTIKTTSLFGQQIANEESYGKVTTTLKMDIYKPKGDTLTKKPVIVFVFGGGFLHGVKENVGIIQLCEAFAKRGFVTATINYRLGMNVRDPELSKRAVYRATQDGRSAVRFFRKNAATYGIDPNKIFISGHSAGAILSYHNVYMDKDAERPASTRSYLGRPDLGGLDGIGDNKTYADGTLVSGKANAVVGFAGALGDLSYIEGSTDVPGAYFHSSDDNVVPYNSGKPFSTVSWIPGINIPVVYGSNLMNTKAASVNATHTFYSYTGRKHYVHYDANKILYPEIVPRTGEFFYANVLKPADITISGSTTVCSNCPPQTYTVPKTAFYYDWQIVGGKFVTKNPYSNTVSVQWDATAGIHTLTATPYSRQLAQGNATNLQISINRAPVMTKNLTEIVNNTKLDLNDYFADPEGQILTYKITSSSQAFIGLEPASNRLAVNKTISGLATIIIEVSDGSPCSTIKTLTVNDSEPLPENIQVTVGPNPFVDHANLTFEGEYRGNIKILLFNENGKILAERNVVKNQAKLEEGFGDEMKKQGIHFIKIITDNDVVMRKVVKN